MDDQRKTRAERMAMPLARYVVHDLAVEHGGWHLDEELLIEPDRADDSQRWWIEKRAEVRADRDQAEADGQDTVDLDAVIPELDEEITKAGMRGNSRPS
jgi:hypothetical protein